MHISIIGAGKIGRLVAFSLLTDSVLFKKGARKLKRLTLVDRKEMEFEGYRRDLLDAAHIGCIQPEIVYAPDTDMKAIEGSQVVIITASAPLTLNMKREDLLEKNRAIAENIGSGLALHAPRAFVIVVSNPLDIMVALIAHYARCPKHRICGSGPLLDTVRAWRILPKYLGGDEQKAKQCAVVGQHGAEMVPVIDSLGVSNRAQARKEIVDEAYAIAQFGGYSSYAPAANIVALARGYLCDEKIVLPVCAFYKTAYIGALATISAKGARNVHMPKVSKRERQEIAKCMEDLTQSVARTLAARG